MNTIILGAGPTGIAAAHKTGGVIYEETSKPGGICMSYYEEGYRFEKGGGHWIFGQGDANMLEAIEFMTKFANLKGYIRRAGVYLNKIYDYPIQNYFGEGPVNMTEGTMKKWLYDKFGNEQCKLFFFPFNAKYTAGLYKYVAPQDEQKNPVMNKGYNHEFLYPEKGLDHMIGNMINGLEIHYNKQAIAIDYKQKEVAFADGTSVKYDRLISTIPLNRMMKLLSMPENEELPYNSTLVMNIGATKGKNCPTEHWLYTPHSKSGFHRVGFYSNVDKSFAPKNRVAIYLEWAFLKEEPTEMHQAIEELKSWGFIKKVDYFDKHRIDIAYTWNFSDSEVRESFMEFIKAAGITQIGRYGAWKFQGIAESIKDGLSC